MHCPTGLLCHYPPYISPIHLPHLPNPPNLPSSTISNPSPAAIASNIALSTNPDLIFSIPNAVANACRYIEAGIRTSFSLGHGNGPINHFHSLEIRTVPPESSLKEWIHKKGDWERRLAEAGGRS
jgi:hypothetical protein